MTAQSSLLSSKSSSGSEPDAERSRLNLREAMLRASSTIYAPSRRKSGTRRRLSNNTYPVEERVKPNFVSGIGKSLKGRKRYASPRDVVKRIQRKKTPKIRLRGLLSQTFNKEFTKRLFDITFSLLVLILFSPVYLLLALLIALNSDGPIFYVQERVGKNYKPFNCIKFRTMVTNADEILMQMMETSPQIRQEFKTNFKLKKDPRITAIGRFLRITSLDEFPQFWNVLKGDMSVVGPRPLVSEELPKYGPYIDEILTIRPGITGLWQVSGRNDIPYPRRVKIDLHYVKFRNFWLDLWIVIKTIGVVMIPKDNGAY